MLGSISTIAKERDVNEWDGYMYTTYIKLRKEVDPKHFEKKLTFLITDRLGPYVAKNFHLNLEEWFARGNKIDLKLIPLGKFT
ncbi:MAG: hypothetical protein HC906_17170 [Bacteroidales bacterium]|nr:hypothetical protein [Bacteroidales bacterium]